MGNRITALTFEEWVAFAFDRRVTRPEWYFDDAADWWAGSPGLTVAHLTRLFEDPGCLMSLYSPAQVSQGLWYRRRGALRRAVVEHGRDSRSSSLRSPQDERRRSPVVGTSRRSAGRTSDRP